MVSESNNEKKKKNEYFFYTFFYRSAFTRISFSIITSLTYEFSRYELL